MQPVEPLAGLGRNRDYRRPAQLRQQPLERLAQFLELLGLVFLEVPFVGGDHHRAAPDLAKSAIRRSCCSKGMPTSSSTTTTSAKRTARRPSATESFFQLVHHLGALAHPGGVKDPHRRTHELGRDRDRVVGDPGLGAGQQAVLADDLVDQRRLARVGATDHRDLQGFSRVGL